MRARHSDLTRRLTEQLNIAAATIETREAELVAQHAENRRLRSMLLMETEKRHSVETDLTAAHRLLHDEKHSHINEELQIMNEELEAAHHRIQERLAHLKHHVVGHNQ